MDTATTVLQKLFGGLIFAEHGPFLQATCGLKLLHLFACLFFAEGIKETVNKNPLRDIPAIQYLRMGLGSVADVLPFELQLYHLHVRIIVYFIFQHCSN